MLRRPAPARLAAGLAVVALLAAGCSGGDDDEPAGGATTEVDGSTTTAPGDADDAAPAIEAVELDADDDLYAAVPDPIPEGEHGDLVAYQEVVPSAADGARTWRVMYLSESLEGEPIVVTGSVVVPTAPAPAGGRPVLTIAHGTTGVADECAPSKGGANELLLSGMIVDDGWIVAVTDYEGLGTPGRHPYLVGESEGRGVLDAVRAAAALPDAEAGTTVAIGGYSQGGHGSLWAGELAGEWTPELDVVGTFAGAPASETDLILASGPTLPLTGFVALMVAGYAEAYPDADPATYLTEEGMSRLGAVDEGCTGDVFEAMAGPPSDLVRADGPASDPWPELGEENRPGQVATDIPVLVIHSDEDEVVPPIFSAALFDRMCGLGQVVERRVLEGGGSHVEAAVPAYTQAVEWILGLVDGAEPTDGCP